MNTVYTCFCTDVIHEGHLNIIKEAQKYGQVIVGVLADAASIRYNRFPAVSLDERIELVKQIPGVSGVVVQNEIMYDEVFRSVCPDYIVHGDNWSAPSMQAIYENIKSLCRKYGAVLIEVPYTRTEKVRKIDRQMYEKLAMPENSFSGNERVRSGSALGQSTERGKA